MHEPKTWDEYLDLVHQAIYETDELRASVEWDPEEMERYLPFLDQLGAQLKKLFEDMTEGRYRFDRFNDLPFMPLVERYGRDIPFKTLLSVINATHRQGL
jgi:hypothetical protein